MERARIAAVTNVDELLTRWPDATRAFLRRRMACPGCPLARFETVAEVCAIYRQPLQPFVAELQQMEAPGRAPDEGIPPGYSSA